MVVVQFEENIFAMMQFTEFCEINPISVLSAIKLKMDGKKPKLSGNQSLIKRHLIEFRKFLITIAQDEKIIRINILLR
ncbi:MAG: hypothetical protein B7Y39_18165 [Bdellovibrio sp. 28-41-41]|nr:MAG: hypothetical protein B7Y39_18165 [Bdellovibrio sp. 28-41-41]